MKQVRKILVRTLLVLTVIYSIICTFLYFVQEDFIFFPEKLESTYEFDFVEPYEEIFIPVDQNDSLNALLFKSENSKGVMFYLHGNGGSLRTWGEISSIYTNLGYDLFILDYRGYGKSSGEIDSEELIYKDVQACYDFLNKSYIEENIIVLGYSLGTGVATRIAYDNNPSKLILQAPYYSMQDLVSDMLPILPGFILRYKFPTNEIISKVKCPIHIFHGEEDEVIPFNSSERLKKVDPDNIDFILLKGQTHNGMHFNLEYQQKLETILSN